MGRYVWVRVPGANKILSLCQVQVLQKKPWVWRQLSGVSEVAQGKPSSQATTELCCHGGDSSRALDGNTDQNYNDASCSHSLTNVGNPAIPTW